LTPLSMHSIYTYYPLLKTNTEYSIRVEAHPRVLSWYGQESTKDACSDEMDNEEAIIAYYTV